MLLQGTDNIKDRSMKFFYTRRPKKSYLEVLFKFIKNWSKLYSEEQTNSYKLNANDEEFSFYEFLHWKYQVSSLVKDQMQEFIIYRDPIILSKETATVQPEIFSKPVSFINIGK